jgi:hypothetical protein
VSNSWQNKATWGLTAAEHAEAAADYDNLLVKYYKVEALLKAIPQSAIAAIFELVSEDDAESVDAGDAWRKVRDFLAQKGVQP